MTLFNITKHLIKTRAVRFQICTWIRCRTHRQAARENTGAISSTHLVTKKEKEVHKIQIREREKGLQQTVT